MTAFRKLFIAAALMATGLGVATLLGDPAAVRQAFESTVHRSQPPAVVAAPIEASEVKPTTNWVASGVQLLPEPAATNKSASAPEAPALLTSLAPFTPTNAVPSDPELARTVAVNESPLLPRLDGVVPMAKLRNEAPRPIGNEPRSPATIRRTPPVNSEDGLPASNDDAYRARVDWSATQPMPTGFMNDTNATLATNAAYNAPVGTTDNHQVSPPPWPAAEERDEPRTHVIVDGDSLEKLAGRYLDDPQRNKEIFELNRDLLSAPDLLPIGAELKIPERRANTSWDRQSRRVGFSSEPAIREAANGDLVPIRPVSSFGAFDGAAPRAQLARPVAAD